MMAPDQVQLPEVRSVTDASNALTALIKGLSSGKLLPEDAEALAAPITAFIRAVEVTMFDDRLSALEQGEKALAEVEEHRYDACMGNSSWRR
jgi:hypothetical protein